MLRLAVLLPLLACSRQATQPAAPAAESPCLPNPPSQEVDLEPAFPDLPAFEQPIALARSESTWLLIQRTGEVFGFPFGAAQATQILDLSNRVDAEMDAGLSGIALSPDFEQDGAYYLLYSTSDTAVLGDGSGAWRSRLSRFTLGSDEETVLLEVEQPESSHLHANGDLHFGPDGMLYLGLGDGGPQADGHGHAQDLGVLQGKILRIDVSGAAYAIPADNPFVDTVGALPEIYAYGLRNPWRFSLDEQGVLWAGDVGYQTWEEIDRIEPGDNLGWVTMEGPECFDADECDQTGLVLPVVSHDHYAARSVTGGRFYRGSALETLGDAYIYADYQYGQLWAFGDDRVARVVNRDGHAFVSFAEEDDGELLAVDVADGIIYRLIDGDGIPGEDGLPKRLSETGCVDPANPSQKIDDFYAYAVNHPFWSDGAEKHRWISMPEDGVFKVGDDGDLTTPKGTILIKEYEVDGLLMETRFMIYRGSGLWTALSYEWDEAQTNATLVPEGDSPLEVDWPTITWTHPTRGMCRECHANAAGGSLGLELPQLAGISEDERLGEDQLAGMADLGWLDPQAGITPFPALDDEEAPVDQRARAFLHVNCGYCHRPGGRAQGDLDLEYSVPIAETGICDTKPDLGDLTGEGARIISPGHPEDSVLLYRVSIDGEGAMPPIGRSMVDEEAVAVLTEWITAMGAGCETGE